MPPSRLPPNESLSNPHGLASSSSLRHQTSQSRLGRTPTASSTRTRQQHDLFAPTLSRRPGGRSTPRIEDEVLADSESDHDPITQRQRPPQMRRLRNGSPESKHLRAKGSRQHAVEEQDIVNRRPDGSYLLEGSGGASTMSTASTLFAQGQVADGADDTKAYDAALARRYFASGAHMPGRRSSKQADEEFEQERPRMAMRLREEVMAKLEDERWLYEPADRFQPNGL